MKRNKGEMRVASDVDETLIFHDIEQYPHLPRVTLNYYGHKKVVSIHTGHVELIKAYKKRGFQVRVWSANGEEWAYEVVTKLGLTDFVDETESKLAKFMDDKDANDVFGPAIFVPVIQKVG